MQVPIAPEFWRFLGVRSDPDDPSVIDVYTKLPFGLSIAPLIFSIFSAEIAAMARGQGLRASSYVDDFPIVVRESHAEHEFNAFKQLFRDLGTVFKESKVQFPAKTMVLLGITVDLEQGLISLKPGYMGILASILEQTRQPSFKPTLTELRSIIGRLNYAALVFVQGRLRMRGLYAALAAGREMLTRRRLNPNNNRAANSTRLFHLWGKFSPKATKQDLQWWYAACKATASSTGNSTTNGGNSTSRPSAEPANEAGQLGKPVPVALQAPIRCKWPTSLIVSDASLDHSAAALSQGRIYITHKHLAPQWFANTCDAELVGMLLPVLANPETFAKSCIICRTDNAGACYILNSLRCRRSGVVKLLSHVLDLAAKYEFMILGEWVPRSRNVAADFWSRIPFLAAPSLGATKFSPSAAALRALNVISKHSSNALLLQN